MKTIVSAITIGLAVTLLSCDTRSDATKEATVRPRLLPVPWITTSPRNPTTRPALLLPLLWKTTRLSRRQAAGTEASRFDVPRPWRYANPDSTKKKNLARCFLNSPLRATAEGQLLVDAGRRLGPLRRHQTA